MIAIQPGRLSRPFTVILTLAAMAGPVGLVRASARDRHPAGATAIHTAAGPTSAPCFFLREWRGHWKTQADARAMYISVSRQVYRLDLAAAYPLLKSPWAVLEYRDSMSTICGPNGLRLVVSDRIGVKQRIIVTKVTRLTPAEVASLPKNLRP
jgi:hypothetical protein